MSELQQGIIHGKGAVVGVGESIFCDDLDARSHLDCVLISLIL
jgi:hypothetical protein